MIINSTTGNRLVIEKSKWLVQNAAAHLRDLKEKHPLDTDMVFRFTVLPSSGPQFMCRLEANGWITLKYFTRRNQTGADIELFSGEYDSFDLSSIPVELFEPRENSGAPAYASVRLPIQNYNTEIDNFLHLENRFQEPESTTFSHRPGGINYLIEMKTTKKYLGICYEEKHPELIHFLEEFMKNHLWFLDTVFSKID